MKSESECPFGKLPYEIKRKIFGYLDLKDRKAARRVCPNWRAIIDEDMTFRAILNNKTKEWLINWSYTPQFLTIQNLTCQNKQFNFEAHHDFLPVVHGYSIGPGVSEKCILDFFRYSNSIIKSIELKTLSLANVHPSNLRRLQPYVKWPDLAGLFINIGLERGIKIGSSERYMSHLKTVLEFLRSTTLPSLRSFGVLLNLQDEWFKPANTTEKMVPYKGIFEFIGKHSTTVRNLDLTIHTDFEQPFKNGKLVKKLCSKLILSHFCAYFDHHNQSLFGYLFKCIRKLKMLKHLDYSICDAKPNEENMVSDVIRGPISKTLETLILHKLNHFDLSCLVKCTKLRDLEIFLVNSGNIRVSPSMVNLIRFSVTSFFGPYLETCFQYLSVITKGMPNLEILEALFHGFHFVFTEKIIEDILSTLPRLYKLTLFPITDYAAERFAYNIPGIRAGFLSYPANCRYFRIFVNRRTYVRGVYND